MKQMKKRNTYSLSFRPRETVYSPCTLRTLRIIIIFKNEDQHIEMTDAKDVNTYLYADMFYF